MAETKNFPLGHVLSIITGRLVASNLMDGVYDILNWMSGESLFTHQLPRVSKEARPVLEKAFPQLATVEIPELDENTLGPWLQTQIAKYGDEFAVPKLNEDEHERLDPQSELVGLVHPSKIITVEAKG